MIMKKNKGLVLALFAVAIIMIGVAISFSMQKSSEKEVGSFQDFHGVYKISNEEYVSLNIEEENSVGYIYTSANSSDTAVEVTLDYIDTGEVILIDPDGNRVGSLKYNNDRYEYTDVDGTSWSAEKISDVSMIP